MNPLVITLIQFLIQYGPEAYAKVVALLHKTDPTQADFLALIDESALHNHDAYLAAARAAASPLPAPVG